MKNPLRRLASLILQWLTGNTLVVEFINTNLLILYRVHWEEEGVKIVPVLLAAATRRAPVLLAAATRRAPVLQWLTGNTLVVEFINTNLLILLCRVHWKELQGVKIVPVLLAAATRRAPVLLEAATRRAPVLLAAATRRAPPRSLCSVVLAPSGPLFF